MWGTSGEIYYKIQRVNHYEISVNESTNSTKETNPLVGQNCTISEFEKNCNASCENLQCVMSIAPRKFFYFYIVFTIFEFFWILSFLSAVLEMVLAGVFATWYWTFNKNELDGNVRSSFYRTFRYHLGTTAFGSLILAIVKFLRFIMETIQKQMQEGSTNIAAIICACLCRCCLEMLENFLSFLNRNAYIMTAVHGTDFIDSAKSAFNLLMRNLLNVIVLDKVTDLVFFVIKFLFSLASATIFYFVFNCLHHDNKFRVGFTIIFFVLMLLISSVFFSVFSMAIDTIFLCYLEDLERNDGGPGRPYFMSTKLRRLLQPKN